jgi:hypothetical protein
MTDRYIEVEVRFPKTSRIEKILLVEEDPEYMDFRVNSFVEQAEKEVGFVSNSVSIKRL